MDGLCKSNMIMEKVNFGLAIEALKEGNGTIEYEVRFYNGGVGFSECLEEAFDKIKD